MSEQPKPSAGALPWVLALLIVIAAIVAVVIIATARGAGGGAAPSPSGVPSGPQGTIA